MERIDWLKWRHQGLGSSDAAAIMGVSRFKTIVQLFEEKTQEFKGEDDGNEWIKNKGNVIEPKIRTQFEMLHGNVEWAPTLVQDANFPFLRASLDGFSPDKTEFVEIKLLGKESFQEVLDGKIPEEYKPQVFHQWNVTAAKRAWLAAYEYDAKNHHEYDSSRLKIIEIPFDETYALFLLEAEVMFWNNNVMQKKPPLPSARDYKQLKGAAYKMNKWKKLKERVEKYSGEMDSLRKEILMMAEEDGHPRLTAAGVRLAKESRRGTVDNKKLYADYNITDEVLDSYRKAGGTSWSMEIVRERESVQ